MFFIQPENYKSHNGKKCLFQIHATECSYLKCVGPQEQGQYYQLRDIEKRMKDIVVISRLNKFIIRHEQFSVIALKYEPRSGHQRENYKSHNGKKGSGHTTESEFTEQSEASSLI